MTYTQHGPYMRNLDKLPKKEKQNIQRIEKQLKKTSKRRKYQKLFTLLESKKLQMDLKHPEWRYERTQEELEQEAKDLQ